MRKIMASLDVGSDTVKLVVGEMYKKKLNVLAIAESQSMGVKKGIVNDQKILVNSIREVIEKCESVIGFKIRQMIVSVPSNEAVFKIVNGYVEIESENNLIAGRDVIKVFKSAIKSFNDETMEYITFMPTSFSLDDGRVVRDPKGLTSSNLTVNGVLISTPKINIYPILDCLDKLGIETLDITIDSIGDYYEFKSKELDRQLGVVVNIGAEKATLSTFNKGVLSNCKIIGIGGKNIDTDISYVYRVNPKDSKYLKEKYAVANLANAQESETIEIEVANGDKMVITQKDLTKVVNSRLEEILNLCKKEINYLTKKEISYIIFTGGLTECREFNVLVEELFEKKAMVGNIQEVGARHNKFSTCLGLLKFYAATAELKDKDYSIFTIEEQQNLGGASLDNQSMVGKLFGYIFNG